ncbi:type II secretion system pilot lipoprotein GspS [Yersinia enterocolitica]|nr:type II secretion system pilot lipoprotein GspS [Yersinia enterocolitica]HDL7389109.1 type II secretion system pilot lipoprotein GspS [Yersinia enterocolitica]
MRLRQAKIIILLTPFFWGCQLNNKNSIDNKFKLEKITALTSGVFFLKENCKTEKLPNEREIINTAMRMITKNKIDVSNELYTHITILTKIRYEEIKSNEKETKIKCRELESIIAPFLSKTGN